MKSQRHAGISHPGRKHLCHDRGLGIVHQAVKGQTQHDCCKDHLRALDVEHWKCEERPYHGRDSAEDIYRLASDPRSEEHTSELQSLMRISYAVFCLKKKNNLHNIENKD